MLKCLLCPATFDDLKQIPGRIYDEARKDFVFHEAEQRAHAAEQNRWQQLQVCLGACGEIDLMIGHICPSCATLESLSRLRLTKADERVNPIDSVNARRLLMLTATDVAPTILHSARVDDPGVNYVVRPEGGTDPVGDMIKRLQAISEQTTA